MENIGGYIRHPLIKPNLIEARDYQINIAKQTLTQNSLVVLPTALGKTIIALLSLVENLSRSPQSKILVMSPTRPLVLQHYHSFQKFLQLSIKCAMFSSGMSAMQRAISLNDVQIIFSTPQIIKNDIENGLYTLAGFSQVIFDETHKARKKYAYTFVANHYLNSCKHPYILGLTASPGKDLYKINELSATLKIENIIFRTSESSDVSNYVYQIDTIFRPIEMPDPILQSKIILESAIRKIKNYLIEKDILPKRSYSSKFEFIQLMQDMKKLDILLDPYLTEIEREKYVGDAGELNFPHLIDVFDYTEYNSLKSQVISKAVSGIYIHHLLEILTTQDVKLFFNYIEKLQNKSKNGQGGARKLLQTKFIRGTIQLLKGLNKFQSQPKLDELSYILQEELKSTPEGKFIIFTQYREMGQIITKFVNSLQSSASTLSAKRFVGQATRSPNDKGLSQKEQGNIINQFSKGDFNVLVATSVAEEGLDIPNVNAVICYDSVPSEIRLIQRRGRTGRHSIGKCYCLVALNTLDQTYFNVSARREEKMHQILSHPESIDTVDKLERENKRPQYKKQNLEVLKVKYKQKKEQNKMESMQKVSKMIEKQERNKITGVQDLTLSLTNKALFKRETQHSCNKKSQYQGLVKKYYRWLSTTIKVIGDKKQNKIYCELDRLYDIAKLEEINIMTIEKEIEQAKKKQICEIRKQMLIWTT